MDESVSYWLLSIVLVLSMLFVLELVQRKGRLFRALNKFGGPPVRPFIGTLGEIMFMNQAKTFRYARIWAKRYKGSYRFLWYNWFYVLNVVRVREAEPLLSSTKNIDKSRFYGFLHPLLGLGLLNSTGQKWMHRRRILTPTFHFNILNGFHQTFVEECDQLIAALSEDASSGKATKLQPVMSRFTLSTICETSMGVKLSTMAGADEYRQKLYEIGEMLVHRLMRPWLHNNLACILTGYQNALQKLLLPVHFFTTGIINQRRQEFQQTTVDKAEIITEENLYTSTKKRYAMLDSLLLAEQKQQIDGEGIREEVDTFTFEGHDTTASALVFIFFTLAREQQVQERIYEEICEVQNRKSVKDEPFNSQDYADMNFMDRAIKECLRLWPPVPFISRTVSEDIVLSDGNIIPAGVIVNIHIFDLHRDPEQFPDPDVFDADRFLPENVDRRNPYAYVPFSAGPRNCIGQKYAMMELKAVVTHTLRQFRVLPKTRLEEINFVADLVLRSTNPIEVKFVKRTAN
ncbi:cytochrome P450 4C1-like [Malaya genurostris]|uniref:cytochrome P450 4C1-like n=1 Tax=Malaya genurostris TaxID=325434 RepID=UPI0026F3E14F|nr:cytochrome P450 4C1-like [Malaya genurostris]